MTRATTFALLGLSAAALLGGALAMGVAAQSSVLAPGLSVGGVPVGGLSAAAAAEAVRAAHPVPQVEVRAGERTWKLSAAKLGYRVNVDAGVSAAVQASEARTWWERARSVIGQSTAQEFPVGVKVNAAAAEQTLAALTAGLGTPPVNATVGFDNATRRYRVLTPDQPGRTPDAAAAARAFAANPGRRTLDVPLTTAQAEFTAQKLAEHAARGNALMRPVTVKLAGADRAGTLAPLQLANLYWVRAEGIVPDEQTLKAAFESLSYQIDQPAQNARYGWRGGVWGKVGEKPGRVVGKGAYEAFRTGLLDPAQSTVTLPSQAQQPTLKLADLPNPAGLELIARGESTYYNSSPERRTNVAVAASKIDGTVVAAGQDFSFLQALGGITADNGFVGGLIISGGRTVDGLGGGVCQVSTTAFRALYLAGLPIVERNQHSYRVGYYEPQVGFEAAVYDPGVDLKMKNDTGAPLLIRTVNNNAASRLSVEVWGKKPPRTVRVSPATILARTGHPPAKYVFNPNLPAGASKQVDWAQDGYNLYITRTIQTPWSTRTDRVDTVYKPWQAVYEYGPRAGALARR